MKLIEVGGKDAVLDTDDNGWNAVHFACSNVDANDISSDVLDFLVQQGGEDVLMHKTDEGKTPFQFLAANAIYELMERNDDMDELAELDVDEDMSDEDYENICGNHVITFPEGRIYTTHTKTHVEIILRIAYILQTTWY